MPQDAAEALWPPDTGSVRTNGTFPSAPSWYTAAEAPGGGGWTPDTGQLPEPSQGQDQPLS